MAHHAEPATASTCERVSAATVKLTDVIEAELTGASAADTPPLAAGAAPIIQCVVVTCAVLTCRRGPKIDAS